MDVAREQARSGAEEGLVVIADEQTAGRGRFRRRWLTPPGSSLALSLLLRPQAEQLPKLGMMAALGVLEAVAKVTALRASLKWPNDVILNGRKLGGILVESELDPGGRATAIVGIGINVNLDVAAFDEIAQGATSLSTELGHGVSRLELLWALLAALERNYEALKGGQGLHKEWAEHLETIGQRVRVIAGGDVEEGLAEAVDEEGRLLLRRDDGSLAHLVGGEVTLRS